MPILILDNHDSFTYNLYQMVQALTDTEVLVVRNDAITLEGTKALQPERIILSPGPGHPANRSDIGVCEDVLHYWEALACPVLGVCLGHQAMAHHAGGHVVPAPSIVHGKTSSIRKLKDSPLLRDLPNPFTVMRYHSWMAEPASIPECFEVIAETDESEPLVMAIQHRERPWFGVQFHPESIGTPEGNVLLRNFLSIPTKTGTASCPNPVGQATAP